MKTPALPTLVAVLGLALPGAAQWHDIPYNPANPVTAEGSLLLHDNGALVSIYSASARHWLGFAPGGTSVVGTGDWCALLKPGPLRFRGYSARYHDISDLVLPAGTMVIGAGVEDDLCYVVTAGGVLGGSTVHAYSAQTNAWATLIVGNAAPAVTSSRFVLGVIDGNGFSGFSARTGAWATFAGGAASPMQARGNVLTVDYFDAAGIRTCAFSGVLGNWAPSPLQSGLAPGLVIDHNVALLAADAGSTTHYTPSGYSAYNGYWTSSTTTCSSAASSAHVRDNVVVVESTGLFASRIEAYGARPGVWASASSVGAALTLIDVREDHAVLEQGSNLMAFSGLCGGAFMTQPTAGTLTHFSGPSHLALAQDGAGDLFAFSAPLCAWSAPYNAPGAVVFAEDSVVVVDDGGALVGYAARHNNWVPGPVGGFAPVTSGGSMIALEDMGTGDVHAWNECCDRFQLLLPGAPGAAYTAGRNNFLLTDAAGQVFGCSVQRGDLVPAPGVAPILQGGEENVSFFSDGARLFGFSSQNEQIAWYPYPRGTEYQVKSGGNTPPAHLRTSLFGTALNAGNVAFWLFGVVPNCPGMPIGTIVNPLLINPGFGIWGLYAHTVTGGVFGARGLAHDDLTLPVGPAGCIQIWMQGLYFDGGTTLTFSAPQPEPAFIF